MNILVNSEGRACLADFGLAVITGDTISSEVEPNSYKTGGTIRWMAPEILNPDRYGYSKRARGKLPSKSTDIYALGMTILEVRTTSLLLLPLSQSPDSTLQVITGRRPFEYTNPDGAVIQKVLGGVRPDRPSVGFSDALWAMLAKTWLEEFEAPGSPPARPNIADILELLQEEVDNWSQTSRPLALLSAIERGPSGMSVAPPELPCDPPDIAGTSSTGSYGFPNQLVGRIGLFLSRV